MNEEVARKSSFFENLPTRAAEIVDRLLEDASLLRASDIHIDPKESDVAIRYRIDGGMDYVGSLPIVVHEELVARLKILSGARTDMHFAPQDGRFRTRLHGVGYNVRASFMPTFYGENAVIRLLPTQDGYHDSLASLGFAIEHIRLIDKALTAPNGLILVTGPTGSGKTTTLRVCLGIKASERISVLTLEDPVEYVVPNVRHIHIRENYGVTFASGLRSALRQDPDVIMLGEIRDVETAKTAVQTALTGHLVLSTLHTRSAVDTIMRLQNMSIERYLMTATLRLVVSQRLVRLLCVECGGLDLECGECRGSGFKGRSVVAEVIEVDDGLRELINTGADKVNITNYLVQNGYRTLEEDASEKVEWGVTTEEEVMKAIHS